jgi:hypothetical protein
LAALLISQKLYESTTIPVQKLCCEGVESKAILEMELLILKQLQFRVASPLLIDQCLEVAYKWDEFVRDVTCIDVKFFHQQLPKSSSNNHSLDHKIHT